MNNSGFKILKIVSLVTLVYCLECCKDPFEIPVSKANQNILVVQGTISDDSGPYIVSLSQAVPFGDQKNIVVKKAQVYVMDDLMNRYDFKDNSNGSYISDKASFKGDIDRTYTLFITTSDGFEYKSAPCKIGPPSTIDSLYGFNEMYLVSPAESNNTGIDQYTDAFHAYTDLSFNSNQKINTRLDVFLSSLVTVATTYYLFDTIYSFKIDPKDTTRVIKVFQGLAKIDSFQIVETSYSTGILNPYPILKTTSNYVKGSKLTKIPLSYVSGTTSSNQTIDTDKAGDTLSTTNVTYGGTWVLFVKAFSISDETFNYYYSLANQVEGKNSFFEPIPIQLKGNITCITDATKLVLGLFQANSSVKKYIKVSWNGNSYRWYPANGIPAPTRDSLTFTLKKK